MVTASATIGAVSSGQFEDGDYATFALWYGVSAASVSDGDHIELTLLDGSSHNFNSNWFNWGAASSLTLTIKGQSNHGGEWNASTAKVVGSLGEFQFQSSSVTLTYQDIIAEFNVTYPLRFEPVGSILPLSASSQYHLVFDRCLMTASPRGAVNTQFLLSNNAYDLDPSGNVSALGDMMVTCKNSVFESNRNGNQLFYFNDRTTWHQNSIFRAQGCTFRDCGISGRPSTESTISEITVDGCMYDTINPNNARLFGGFQNVPTSSISGVSFTDYISAGINFNYLNSISATLTNCTSAATFNYDGTVTAGEVNFVDNAGASAFRDYRLVADPDNLAVRYMDLSSIVTARDVANVKRCGSTDTGAFQSVSDRVLSATVPTEYASFYVFTGTLGVGGFLNGDTFHIKYEDGVYNEFANIYTTDPDHTAGREVDLNIIVEGENHHQGYWSSGAIFKAVGTTSHGRQTTSYLWKNIVIDNDNHPNWPYRHNKYAGDVTKQYGHYVNQYETDEVYDDTITFENCLIRVDAFSFLQGTWDSSIDDRPNEHPKSDPNTKPLIYSNSLSSIVKAGTISTNYKNCAIEALTPGLAFDAFSMPSYQIRKTSLVGCSVKNISLAGLTWPSESTVELSGCLIDTSGANYFITQAWGGSPYLEQQPHFTWTDCIFTDTSSNSDLFNSYSYQIPAGSGALENSIASGYINNCTFGVPFNYDNTLTSGEVCFVGSANSSALDFRLVADPDNLAVRYMDLSSIWEDCSKDITGRKRPGSTDAGAFQSVSNRIISGNIPAEYATPQLLYTTQDTSSFLNGDTYLAVIESGSSTNGTYLYGNTGGREVDLTIHMKGASSHEGNWDQGTIIVPGTPTGYLPNTSLNSARQDIKLVFEDIVFSGNHTNHNGQGPIGGYKFAGNGAELTGGDWWAGAGLIGTAPELASKSRNAYNFEFKFNNCMIQIGNRGKLCMPQVKTVGAEADGTLTQGITKGSFNNTLLLGSVTVGEIYAIDALYGITGQLDLEVIGSTFRNVKHFGRLPIYGSVKVIGSLIETGPGGASGVDDGYAESFLDRGWHYNNRYLTFSATDSIFSQASADLIALESGQVAGSGMLINSIASGFVTNTQFGVPFTFDGTVTNGEVGFQAGGNALSTPRSYYPVADLDNLAVQYIDTAELSNRDIAKVLRPGLRDAGAFQSVSTSSLEYKIGTSAVDFEPAYATIQLWRGSSDYNLPVLNGMTTKFILGAEEMKPNLHYISDGVRDVNQSFIFEGFKAHEGNWTSGTRIFVEASDPIYNSARQIARFDLNNNEIDVTMKDLAVSSQMGVNLGMVVINARNLLNSPYTNNYAPSCNTTIRNMMILFENHQGFVVGGDYREVELDSEGNVVERAEVTSNIENSLIVQRGFTTQACNLHYPLNSIQAQHNVNIKGCTLINTQIPNFGLAGFDNQMKVSVTGSLIHNDANQLSQNNRLQWLGRSGSYVSGSVTDTIFSFVSGSVAEQANQSTTLDPSAVNTSYDTVFNFDGSVSAGTVSFESSATKDYRLVPDQDNLAVQYTNSLIGRRDIAGEPRPAEGDVGAFQSISTNVSSFSIGASANFNTFTLMHNTIKNDILNGDTIEAEFLSGTHSIAGYTEPKEVNHSYVLKAHASAYHNGDWNSGVNFSGGSMIPTPQDHSFSLTLKDIVVRNHEAGVLMLTYGTTNKSGAYKYSTILDSCLIETGSRFVFNNAWTGGQTLDDSGNVVEVHDRLLEFRNCAIHGLPSCQYVGVWGSVSPQGCAHIEANCIGTTFAKLDPAGAAMNGFFDLAYTGNAEDGSLTYNISGSLIGSLFTHASDIYQGNGLNAPKVFNFADSVFDDFPMGIPGLIINKTINETNVTNFSQNNNLTNVPFTFDGTVKSGKVCFVDNGGATSLPDLRLVADLDNLPVKYMTQDSLTYKDITGYKRPGGIDQRDAGAYQSISDKNTVYKIGISGVDFPADYATATLWWSTNYNYANVLNGETHTLQFKSGEIHNPAAGINFNGTDGSVSANVNQSFVYSGQTPHNGNWDEGATLVIDGSTNGATLRCGKNSFNFTVKDLSLVVSGNASNRRLLRTFPTHNTNYSIPGYLAPEFTYTFENFMARMDDGLSSIPYTIVMDQNYERITDEDLNIIERGSSKSIHKNCLYVGAASSNGLGDFGSLNVYSHQYDTQASAFFQTEGCTFINSWFSNNRHVIYDYNSNLLSNLKVDHAGLLFYASESHPNQFGRQLTLHSPGNFGPGEVLSQNITASNNSKFVDCIFNNGAGDSIAGPGSQDRYTTWVIEPLPSEYTGSTSADVEPVQPWNVWASALTNCSFRVPFNFDGSVSAGTVSFVDGSSGVNDYRLVGSEDNFASGYVSSFNLSGLDLAGNDRGDSPYDAGAFAITLQQVEDFLKSLGGPLVLQVGYRISNNRQRLIPVIGGGE